MSTKLYRIIIVAVTAGAVAPADATPRQAPARWTLVPDLRIGSIDDPEYSLTSVGAIAVGANGTMYVVQYLDRQLVMFDRDGRLLGRIGRQGGGPGEFESPGAPKWRADTLVVPDFRLQRLTFFTADGQLIGTERLVSPPSANRWFFPTVPTALLPDGSAVVRPSSMARSQFEGRSRVPLLRLGRSGTVLDTLAWLDVSHSALALQHGDGAFFTGQPLADDPLWQVAPDGSSMVFIDRLAAERRNDARFVVTKITGTGDTVYSRPHEYDPIAVPRGFIDSVVESVSERASRRTFPSPRAAARAIREALYMPDFLPPVTGVVIGRDGTVWLKRESATGDSIAWNVLDESGNMVAILTLPKGLRVQEAQRDLVWAVERDELDVPYVVRFRVER
jgi:hypothetical protein